MSRRALIVWTVLLVIAIVESFTHPFPFLPLGYGPFVIWPGLQLGCLLLIAVIGWQAWRIGRRFGIMLLLTLVGTIALCAILHEPLVRLRFELGRSAIEREIAALCAGKSQFRSYAHPPGNFRADPDWPIGTEYVLSMQASPQFGYAQITTGGVLFSTFGFETTITTAADGSLAFGAWKPWAYAK